MVQGNCSFSTAGVLRGLHYHLKQADLWNVPIGQVRAVLYDFRQSSPTRGAAEIVELGEANRVALYIPKGVAHGFLALRESYMTYLVDEYYDNSDELGILWNDPALGVDWGAAVIKARPRRIVRASRIGIGRTFASRRSRRERRPP
jgi:dTDP-4-dehydrorhamnose 3,5-epimerase